MSIRFLFNKEFYHFLRTHFSSQFQIFLQQQILKKKYPGARIDGDSKIVKPENVTLGEGVKIDRHVYLNCGGIQAYHSEGFIYMADQVLVGLGVKMFCPAGKITIGRNTRVGLGALLTTTSEDSFANPDVSPAEHVHVSEDIVIGENCMIAGSAVILGGTVLGNFCIVGAGAVVKGKYPDHTTLIGNPARAIPRLAFEKK